MIFKTRLNRAKTGNTVQPVRLELLCRNDTVCVLQYRTTRVKLGPQCLGHATGTRRLDAVYRSWLPGYARRRLDFDFRRWPPLSPVTRL